MAKSKTTFLAMTKLMDNEKRIDKEEDIQNHIVNCYENLYSQDSIVRPQDTQHFVRENFTNIVSPWRKKKILTANPNMEEVKNVVFNMNKHGTLGPDGFGEFFFQKYWSIVGQDVFAFVEQFFLQNWIMLGMNSNAIALIPKTTNVVRISDFRPIGLANFRFKIISKILDDRLEPIANRIISKHQKGFLKGRDIKYCIISASEAINLLNEKAFRGCLALKVDIQKAFDTIDWNYLISNLMAFGFNIRFCSWIRTILESTNLSIRVNGNYVGYFKCYKGVRQGDPLSPLLLCLAEEGLSIGLQKAFQSNQVKYMTSSSRKIVHSHVLYADDIFIFYCGQKKSLVALNYILDKYALASG